MTTVPTRFSLVPDGNQGVYIHQDCFVLQFCRNIFTLLSDALIILLVFT